MIWIYKLVTLGIPYEWSKRDNNKKIIKCDEFQYESTVVHNKKLILKYSIFESELYEFIENEFHNEAITKNGIVSIEHNSNVKH